MRGYVRSLNIMEGLVKLLKVMEDHVMSFVGHPGKSWHGIYSKVLESHERSCMEAHRRSRSVIQGHRSSWKVMEGHPELFWKSMEGNIEYHGW